MSAPTNPSMIAATPEQRLSVGQMVRIWHDRLIAVIGWPGAVGLALGLMAAGSWLALLHVQSKATLQPPSPAITERAHAPSGQRTASEGKLALAPPSATPTLPAAAQSALLLTRMAKAFQRLGIEWPRAEYHVNALGPDSLATLEIQLSTKGSYPKLRQLISSLLNAEPALALRELALTRPNTDMSEVEARMVWVLFLADGWPPQSVDAASSAVANTAQLGGQP